MKPETLPQKILLQVVKGGLVLKEIFYNPTGFAYNPLKTSDKIERQFGQIRNALWRLKKEGYLEEVEERGQKKLRATLKGQVKAWPFLRKNRKWDDHWRIVIFDIPEIKKEMREHFRNGLRALGFRQLQKSVWICPYNIADKIESLIELYEAEKYVHYILVEEIDNRDVLMKLFRINKN